MLQRLLLALILGLAACGSIQAQSSAQGGAASDPEAFLHDRLLAGEDVDMHQGCRVGGPGAGDNDTQPCGSVSGAGLAKLLRDKTIAQALPAHGLVITGLQVRDAVELRWTDVAANIVCRRCRFDGDLVLEGASFDHGLRFEGSDFRGACWARASSRGA